MLNGKSTSTIEALPFARQAWLCMTNGEQHATRLGMVPMRMYINFGKFHTPHAFRTALTLIARETE